MSIADKLQRLLDTKEDIRVAIEGKGRDLTGKTFEDDWADEITAIETGGGAPEIEGQEIVTATLENDVVAFDPVLLRVENKNIEWRDGNSGGVLIRDMVFSHNNEYLFSARDTVNFPNNLGISKYSSTLDYYSLSSPIIPNEGPNGNGRAVAISPDDVYFALGISVSPFIVIFKRDGDTFTKLADPDILPSGAVTGLSFSPDNNYLAVSHFITPSITVYKRSGDSFNKIPNPNFIATNGLSVDFSPDNNYIAYSTTGGARLFIYELDQTTDTLTRVLINSTAKTVSDRVKYSPDGAYLATSARSTTNHGSVVIWEINGDQLVNPKMLVLDPMYIDGVVRMASHSVDFSFDSNYLLIRLEQSPYIIMYKRTIDGWVLAPFLEVENRYYENRGVLGSRWYDLNYFNSSLGRAVFSKDSNWIAISTGNATTPYNLYKVNPLADLTEPEFYASNTNVITTPKSTNTYNNTIVIPVQDVYDQNAVQITPSTYDIRERYTRLFDGTLRQYSLGYVTAPGLIDEESQVVSLFTFERWKRTL